MKLYFRSLGKNRRSGGIICLLAMLIFGCFSITATSLLIRSEKKTEIEETLTITGDYDVIVYEAQLGFEDDLANSEKIDRVGLYYELGTVTNTDESGTFKAVALKDSESEDLYHLTCFRGEYPKNANEIAIDVSVATTYGMVPYPGETILLKSYDSSGEYIGDKEYVVSGIFRLANNDVYGGWNRAPSNGMEYKNYQMPAVFFSPTDLDRWNCTKETVFFTAPSSYYVKQIDEVYQAISDSGKGVSGIEYNDRRNSVYSWFVGLDRETFYGQSMENRKEAIEEGSFEQDFYSKFVFPVISFMVIVTEAVSIYMLSKNIIANRKEHYAVLRSIGMSAKKLIGCLLTEILGLGALGAIIGIALGYISHMAFVRIFNSLWHLQLYDGIHVERMIKQITYDPIVASILVSVCALILSLIVPLYRLYKMYPTELLTSSDSMFVGKEKKRKMKSTSLKKGWLRLLNKRINLHEGSTLLVMMIVLSSALFGYVFFRAFSEQATSEERSYMKNLGMEGDGYVVTRNPELKDLGENVSNRHDAGIIPSFPEQIENNSNVERIWSVMMNESTRMVFHEEPAEEMKQLLGNRSLNRPESDDPYLKEARIAEATIFGHMGYDTPVYMYELPTVGLTEKEMNALNGELISGSIDIDKIKSGEEVVLAVPEELKDLCLKFFPVGTSFDFDDILLSEEEEKLENYPIDEKWIVYDNYIETEMGQAHVGYASFGTRYGIRAKVGAIVVLHNEKDITEYLTTGTDWVRQLHYGPDSDPSAPKPTYGMSVMCLPETFENWGLPDRNFTSVKVEMKDDYDVYGFDKFWYQSLSGSVDVKNKSTFDYTDTIKTKSNRVMTIFFLLIFVLAVLGVVSIITGLYTKTRTNSSRFQTLRRVGLSVKQASIMIYSQNMFNPILAIMTAIIPICVVQKLLHSYRDKILSGGDTLDKAWKLRIPVWTDLFSYNFIPALILCLLLGFLLVFIGTLPQITYLRKMKMVETREE